MTGGSRARHDMRIAGQSKSQCHLLHRLHPDRRGVTAAVSAVAGHRKRGCAHGANYPLIARPDNNEYTPSNNHLMTG